MASTRCARSAGLPDEERARLREEGKGKALLLRQIERRFEGVN